MIFKFIQRRYKKDAHFTEFVTEQLRYLKYYDPTPDKSFQRSGFALPRRAKGAFTLREKAIELRGSFRQARC